MMIQDRELMIMGNNVEALRERIKNYWHITFRNELGEPLLIFPETFAAIMRIKDSDSDELQLLFRMNITYYILTFSSCDEAKKFSEALLEYVTLLYMKIVPADVKARWEENQITIDSRDV